MSTGLIAGPKIRYVGNVRDLLAMVCSAQANGWVLEFGREGWKIRVCPMLERLGPPYRMSVTSPAGVETKVKHGIVSVEDAVIDAITSLRGAGLKLGEYEMMEIARGIDSRI